MSDVVLMKQNFAGAMAMVVGMGVAAFVAGCGGRSHAEKPDGSGLAGGGGSGGIDGGGGDGGTGGGIGPAGGGGTGSGAADGGRPVVDGASGGADSGVDAPREAPGLSCGAQKTCATAGICVPPDGCCDDSDCATPCQKCGAGNACDVVKNAESLTCSGDHICDESGSCASRFTVFPIPNGGVTYSVTTGADGNVWFTETLLNRIGKMTPSGVVTDYPIPTANSAPTGLASASDGNIWFGEYSNGSKIGKVTPTGTIAEYQLEAGSFIYVQAIVQGPGAPWFSSANVVGIGTGATLASSVHLPGNDSVTSLAIGSDSNIWYASSGDVVGRITVADLGVKTFTVPQQSVGPSPLMLGNLTLGSDGALWFSESTDNQIGRIDSSGSITEFTIPTPKTMPAGTCLGPDGNVWFVEGGGHGVVHLPNGNDASTGGLGRITPKGEIVDFGFPPALAGIGVTAGSDGNIWVADGFQIIRFRLK